MFVHITEAMSKKPNDWCAVDKEHNLVDRDWKLSDLVGRMKEKELHETVAYCLNWGRAIPDRYLNMKTFYVTFGQVHVHHLPGLGIFDKDCVAVIHANDYAGAREKAFKTFGDKWSNFYMETAMPTMSYYPRGLMEIEYDLV